MSSIISIYKVKIDSCYFLYLRIMNHMYKKKITKKLPCIVDTLLKLNNEQIELLSDNLLNKFGPIFISIASLFFMFLGVILVILSSSSILAIMGFLFMGAGSAVIFPMAISMIRVEGRSIHSINLYMSLTVNL